MTFLNISNVIFINWSFLIARCLDGTTCNDTHTHTLRVLGFLDYFAITCWLKNFPCFPSCFILRILAFQCTANNSLGEQRQSWEEHWSWNCYRKWGHLGLTHPHHRTIHYEDSHSVTHYFPGIAPGILHQFSSLRSRSLLPDCSFHRRFRVLQVRVLFPSTYHLNVTPQ